PTASRSTATAWSRSAGGPNTPGPASCIAPNPTRLTVRSPSWYAPPGSELAEVIASCLLGCHGTVHCGFTVPRGGAVRQRPAHPGSDGTRLARPAAHTVGG